MNKKYYAHSLEGRPVEEWQPLVEHLENVAAIASEFAKPFGGAEWACLAGLLHDKGKESKAFQAYLRRANEIIDEFAEYYNGRVDHSTFGARVAYNISNQGGKILAYTLAGHHSGLIDWQRHATHGLKYRLQEKKIESIENIISDLNIPKLLPINCDQNNFGFQLQFFVRMIFSCLVDADFLDTEKFLNPGNNELRKNSHNLEELNDLFHDNFNALRKFSNKSKVNQIREDILKQCLNAAELSPGMFSLTVPTGGGKTLASLAFALKHAMKYGKQRIIYVIPFTSIIEQNAQVFRDMLGDEAVLEHHCNYVNDVTDWKTKLSSENWDVPIVVTTNVQFFDSFFSNKTSKCRKLHNIANSVVVFDEVQAIPVEKLQPCLEIIRELSLNYNVSSVLCSATQPAIQQAKDFRSGLKDVREIMPDVKGLFQLLKRVEVSHIGKQENGDIAKRMQTKDQVLCVVSTRKQAQDIFEKLGVSKDNFHLSALMYPAHRTRILIEIKKRLKEKQKCRVVSTQLIEAGVDVDFPVVFRALSGMDSIAQAAGRCNREGLRSRGEVFIFEPEAGIPAGFFRQTAQCSERLLDKFKGELLEPECIREYFLNYYWQNQDRMDKDGILNICQKAERGNIQFEEIAEFKMIQNATEPIVIAVEDIAEKLIEKLSFAKYPSGILRQLQQYTVQIYPYNLGELDAYLESNKYIRILRLSSLYDEKVGLVKDVPEYLNIEDTII